MSTTSPNYGFILPASTDLVSIGDINANFSWIDANLASTIEGVIGTIDSSPTANSTNLVTSGGVATALALKLDKAASAYSGHSGEIFYINGYAQAVHKTFGAGDFALTGYVDPSTSGGRIEDVAATDTIVQALQKIVKRLKLLENA